jgi:hypothetical protein
MTVISVSTCLSISEDNKSQVSSKHPYLGLISLFIYPTLASSMSPFCSGDEVLVCLGSCFLSRLTCTVVQVVESSQVGLVFSLPTP